MELPNDSSPQICHIQHQHPTSTHSSLGASLRKERAQRSLRHLLMPIITALLSLVDIVMDCYLVASHWHQGDTNWAVYTLCVVLFSMFIVDVVSASFYYSDQRDSNKTEWMKRIKLPVVRPWFYAFHCILLGRFVRCFQIFRTVRKVRGIKKDNQEEPTSIQCNRLYISQLYEMSILSVVEAFTEEAPQVALHSYILLQKGSFDWSSSSDVFAGTNAIKSLLLFSYSLLNFAVQIRLSNKDSVSLKWVSWASLFFFFFGACSC
ncbi:XK-related protein 9-like [Montipora capricornis]|uniref:XK-related protein 9-like n=1 Tax=Montipora capricornis TaxID=246305 RepID=UPI0035F109BB